MGGTYGSQGLRRPLAPYPLVNLKAPKVMNGSAVYCADVHVTRQQLHPSVML